MANPAKKSSKARNKSNSSPKSLGPQAAKILGMMTLNTVIDVHTKVLLSIANEPDQMLKERRFQRELEAILRAVGKMLGNESITAEQLEECTYRKNPEVTAQKMLGSALGATLGALGAGYALPQPLPPHGKITGVFGKEPVKAPELAPMPKLPCRVEVMWEAWGCNIDGPFYVRIEEDGGLGAFIVREDGQYSTAQNAITEAQVRELMTGLTVTLSNGKLWKPMPHQARKV